MTDQPPTDPENAGTGVVGQSPAMDEVPARAAPRSKRVRRVIVATAMVVTTAGAWLLTRDWGMDAGEAWGPPAIGMLIGLVIGLQIIRMRDPVARRKDPAGFLTHAGGMLALSVISSALAAVLLALLLISGEGASLVLIPVLPLTALCWLMGGRMVSGAARRALQEIGTGRRPEAERPTLELALTLGRLLGVAFLGLLVWLLLARLG